MGRIAEGIPIAIPDKPQSGCKLTRLMRADDIDDEDRAAITAKLSNRDLSDDAVSLWLLSLGERITASTIRNHRRGLCCGGTGKVR